MNFTKYQKDIIKEAFSDIIHDRRKRISEIEDSKYPEEITDAEQDHIKACNQDIADVFKILDKVSPEISADIDEDLATEAIDAQAQKAHDIYHNW